MEITIVTACPGGHTTAWLAARRLAHAAERRGWKAVFDSAGQETSDLVVVAASAPVDLSRHAGRALYRADMADALADPEAVLDAAHDRAEPYEPSPEIAPAETPPSATTSSMTAAPAGTKDKPTRPEARPAQSEAKPTQTETAHTEVKPVRPEPESARTKTEPTRAEPRPARTEAKPARTETKPARTETKPARTEARSYRAEDEPDRAKPTRTETKPKPRRASIPERPRASIVAVTATPSGTIHRATAADALAGEALSMGHDILVEVQGAAGVEDALKAEEIAVADIVLLACDVEIDESRFVGKRIYRTSARVALTRPRATINAALDEAVVQPVNQRSDRRDGPKDSARKPGVYRHLLTGVSFMLPMAVVGGLCIALSFLLGVFGMDDKGGIADAFMQIGADSAFKLMVPVLAGYIAYSIADRPGLAPGLIGGWLAAVLGAGFIGGGIAGFLGGYWALALKRCVPLSASVQSLGPLLIIPLLTSLATGLLMIFVIGPPLAMFLDSLTDFFKSMGTTHAALLGLLLGGMMCLDMGGPINKTAYIFGLGLLSSQTYLPMAAVMAGGMVPSIGLGITSLVVPGKFAEAERKGGRTALILGLCFITEGAIPFAAKDPIRVIPSCVAGGAIAGGLSMFFGCGVRAPHGGLFVILIPGVVTHALLYVAAIVTGSVVTGLAYAAIKPRPNGDEQPSFDSSDDARILNAPRLS